MDDVVHAQFFTVDGKPTGETACGETGAMADYGDFGDITCVGCQRILLERVLPRI